MMQSKAVNLQDAFLNNIRKNGVLVTVHVTNGFQIKNAKVLGGIFGKAVIARPHDEIMKFFDIEE